MKEQMLKKNLLKIQEEVDLLSILKLDLTNALKSFQL